MRIVLIGAPGSGKQVIAEALAEATGKMLFLELEHQELAWGPMADYRLEAQTAMRRALNMPTLDDTIFKHTVLDSMAYSTRRLVLAVEASDFENYIRYSNLVGFLSVVVSDSLQADYYFFCAGNDGEDFSDEIEEALAYSVEALDLPLIVLEGTDLQKAEQAVNIVKDDQEVPVDAGRDSKESDKQD